MNQVAAKGRKRMERADVGGKRRGQKIKCESLAVKRKEKKIYNCLQACSDCPSSKMEVWFNSF